MPSWITLNITIVDFTCFFLFFIYSNVAIRKWKIKYGAHVRFLLGSAYL